MATKTHNYTAKIQYDADGTPPYTDLADVKMIQPPNMLKGDVNTTHLESADHTEDFIPGWRRAEDVTFDCYFTKTQFNTLLGFYNSETIYYWRILFPLIDAEANNSRLDFKGYVKGVAFNQIVADEDDAIMCPITIKLTQPKMTFTAGS